MQQFPAYRMTIIYWGNIGPKKFFHEKLQMKQDDQLFKCWVCEFMISKTVHRTPPTRKNIQYLQK